MTDRQAEPARPVHVLVIDDNTINLTVLREMLEGMGHSVATAANGAEGFKAAMGQPFEVIFMDINMPDMDGIELTRRIRASDGPNRTSRIHGLTAYGEEEFRDPAIAAGMNGFSNKPIRMQTLAAILRDKPAEAPVSPVKAGAIDVVVVNELRDALGDARLRQNAGTFFSEMEALIAELRQPGGTEARLARLHDLSGAAALFGLRALVAGIRSLEADIDQQDGAQLAPAVERLRDLARDTQARFFKALDTPRPAKSGAAPPGETAGAARDARGG